MGTILTPIDAEVKASHFEKCYASPVGQNGIDEKNSVISQHIKMCLQDGEWFSTGVPQYCRNNNILVIGNKENYVTHFFIPNILMANADFVIYDPENELYEACAPELIKNGYKIETVNEKDAGSFNITSLNNPSEKIAVFINDNNYLVSAQKQPIF